MSAVDKEAQQPGALAGLKVLDLSRFIAGPHCAMMLADLGAEVTKVERPRGGDDARAFAPIGENESLYFMVFNRNKQSVTLNFRDARGQELLRKLIARADVLIENFRPGTMEQMGCGWETLHELNPRLIMARISGYGQSGPLAAEPCFDALAQATTGLMEMTGQPEGPPTVCGTYVVDYCTALYATIGILGALTRRQQIGEGQLVDVSLMGCAVSLLMTAIPEQILFGRTTTRMGNRDRYSAPAQTFKTRDGAWVYLLAGGDAHFPRLVGVMERPDLLEDPRFATNKARMNNIAAIEAIVGAWVAEHDCDETIARMRAAELPCAKVASIADVVANPYMREAAHITSVAHPKAGEIPMQGLPIRLSESPATIRSAAPVLGADTAAVLNHWLGLGDAEIAELRSQGVV